MAPYLFVAGSVALMALVTPLRRLHVPLWMFTCAMLILFVGLRHNVGMDWNNYLVMIDRAGTGDITEAMEFAEPMYASLLWVTGQLGLGIYGANVVVAAILMAGLFRYARTTPSPWIALLVSVPFVVVVTGMSANRQAAAIGILLWLIAGWGRSSVLLRTSLVLLAASFHASAIIFLGLVVADLRIRRIAKAIAVALFSFGAAYFLMATEKAEYYDDVYGSGQMELTQSSGAVFHVLLNGGPALVYFLMARYRPVLLPNDLHRHMAALAIVLILFAFVTSAAAGRVSLYLFPVSMYIFAALPALIRGRTARLLYRFGVVALFVFVLVFWLQASNTGFSYLPYRNFFTVDPALRQLCC